MHPDFIKLVPDLLPDLLNRGLTSLEVLESALYDELMELGRLQPSAFSRQPGKPEADR